jgi:hypothetical protein
MAMDVNLSGAGGSLIRCSEEEKSKGVEAMLEAAPGCDSGGSGGRDGLVTAKNLVSKNMCGPMQMVYSPKGAPDEPALIPGPSVVGSRASCEKAPFIQV